MPQVFVDTSFWYDLGDSKARSHPAVVEWLDRRPDGLVSSNHVFAETVTLVRKRNGHAAAARLGDALRESTRVKWVAATTQDEDDAWARFCERTDQHYSFVDCTSFVIMERLGIRQAATFDRDFEREGFETIP